MAYILIDGYNLIGVAHDNLEEARNDIIQKLQKYSDIKRHNITLVFDGWKSGKKDESKIKTGSVTVIYSKLGEKADLVIRKILSSTTKPWIVVSSDREISDFASKKDFAAISSDEFEGKLYSTFYSKQYDSISGDQSKTEDFLKYEDDIDIIPARQKGNPRKLSKRQKKKLQALKKL